MKDTKRARRRRHHRRMKAKARRVYPHDHAAKAANHLKVCSCWMCGNPRRYGETPIAERRSGEGDNKGRLAEW